MERFGEFKNEHFYEYDFLFNEVVNIAKVASKIGSLIEEAIELVYSHHAAFQAA